MTMERHAIATVQDYPRVATPIAGAIGTAMAISPANLVRNMAGPYLSYRSLHRRAKALLGAAPTPTAGVNMSASVMASAKGMTTSRGHVQHPRRTSQSHGALCVDRYLGR